MKIMRKLIEKYVSNLSKKHLSGLYKDHKEHIEETRENIKKEKARIRKLGYDI